MKIFVSSLILFFLSNITFSQSYIGQIFPNFQIYPSLNNQIEPSISIHPNNPQILFASAYTIKTSSTFRSEGIYVSTNGGLNWFGSDTCSGLPLWNHAGDPGPIIDKNGIFIVTHQGSITGMYANYSTNLGLTWSDNYTIASTVDQDKGSPGSDIISTSPYYGRTYLAWTKFAPPYPIVFAYTTNSGISWVAPNGGIQVNNTPGGHIAFGANALSNSYGNIFVCWASAISTSPFTEDYIGIAKSTNGGINWTAVENAYDCNGIKSSNLQPWGIRVTGYPAMDIDKTNSSYKNWLYIVTAEKNLSPAGSDPDIIFHRSTDDGLTWSAGIRVNQDMLNNGKVQLFPMIRVDENGGINVIYFDNRDITSDSMQVYLSRSTNAGNNWTDYRISSHRFLPKPIGGGVGVGNQGDNIGLTSGNGKLYPVWMDDHTGLYQVWTAIIDYNSIGIKNISTNIPDKLFLQQNFPNPFNPVTNIKFGITKKENIKINIFDINGKIIATIANEEMEPGEYNIIFDAGSISSGVYFYQLSTSAISVTKSMIVLK